MKFKINVEYIGRPIRLSNLTFIWKAPDRDVGIIRAVASVAYNNFYQRIYSREIPFEPFPVSTLLLESHKLLEYIHRRFRENFGFP